MYNEKSYICIQANNLHKADTRNKPKKKVDLFEFISIL